MFLKIIKVLILILIFIFALLSFGYIYQNIPSDPQNLFLKDTSIEPEEIIDYGTTPVFMENLRFNHDDISFFIEPSCTLSRKNSMKQAFQIFQSEMKIISFHEISSSNADIEVGCSEDFIKINKNFFRAGEGGPSKIINTSKFKIIEKGKISLYKDSECKLPVVEIHELGHVFGFDHTNNPKNIMYNISKCDQKISPDMVKIINELYSIEPLPDARISELTAVKKKRYLDFNITVLNEGLESISNMSLTIVSEGKEVSKFYLGDIKIGYGRSLYVTNIRLPTSNVDAIDFYLDRENSVRELNEENNFAQMKVK